MNLDQDRLAGLARTKLEGLVRRAFPDVEARAESFNAGVGIHDRDRAFVYLIDSAPSPLAAALAWGTSRGAEELHVVADDPGSLMARQAPGLSPRPSVWKVVGADLVPVTAVSPPAASPRPEAVALISTLEAAGCDVVIEHGVVIGEMLGLEVARVVTDALGAAEIRVGVGLYDQEAHALLNASTAFAVRVGSVLEEVRRHRRLDAGPHPLNRVARERWLRALVVAEPGVVGLDEAILVEPLVPRAGIHEARPVAAAGSRGDESVLLVASTGIDLDLVPTAAGHLAESGADRVLLLLPERDHHRVIRRQAEHLAAPFDLVAIDDPWPH